MRLPSNNRGALLSHMAAEGWLLYKLCIVRTLSVHSGIAVEEAEIVRTHFKMHENTQD